MGKGRKWGKKLPKDEKKQTKQLVDEDPSFGKKITGFATSDSFLPAKNEVNTADQSESEDDEAEINAMRPKKEPTTSKGKSKKKSGSFDSLGLSHNVLTGIKQKGYNLPTPIQRKTLPVIMEGQDVVAMARTGSGKTAAFLIPMFERLKMHKSSGARALILSPTRELALQTCKFTKELGKYTGLKAAVILGGDAMEEQFAALHENPDIVIATPGRLMHVCVEMEMKLSSVEYVVFDEADRLFEMGFQEQMNDIMSRLAPSRQTLLFSATLPKMLVDFAQAGLDKPELIRLDMDHRLSENLRTVYIQCISQDRTALLLYLLQHVIKPDQQTVVFVATKQQVDYLALILSEAGLSCSSTYSAMDPTARKINVAKFRFKKTMILLVTDLAARGIDIPMLDNVINYNFPAKPKLFVHRVGRVARAGQSGTAYSLVSADEVPYMLDMHLGLGRNMKFVMQNKTYPEDVDGMYGTFPHNLLDTEEIAKLKKLQEISTIEKTTMNSYKAYVRSRPPASKDANKRAKEIGLLKLGFHPVFKVSDAELAHFKVLEELRNYKPKGTIFEINLNKKKNAQADLVKKLRAKQSGFIARHQEKTKKILTSLAEEATTQELVVHQEESTAQEIEDTFSRVVTAPKYDPNMAQKNKMKKQKKRKREFKIDEEHYIHYRPKDYHAEKSLSLTGGSNFTQEANDATLELQGDDQDQIKKMNKAMKWDRKRKRYVAETGQEMKSKKIRTESGQLIPATYKTNIYTDWLAKTKKSKYVTDVTGNDDDDDIEGQPPSKKKKLTMMGGGKKRNFHTQGMQPFGAKQQQMDHNGRRPRKELKPFEQIAKEREVKERKQAFQRGQAAKHKKGKGGGGKGGSKGGGMKGGKGGKKGGSKGGKRK